MGREDGGWVERDGGWVERDGGWVEREWRVGRERMDG